MFSIIGKAPEAASKIVSYFNETTAALGNIISSVGKLTGLFLTIPSELVTLVSASVSEVTKTASETTAGATKNLTPDVTGTLQIKPTFSIPTIPMPVNPLQAVMDAVKSFDWKMDLCHLDFSMFGTIMKAIMFALTKLVDMIIAAVVTAINKMVEMFLNIVESINNIKTWLENAISSVWRKVKDTYDNWYENMENSEGMLGKLWERAVLWFDKKTKEISTAMEEIKTAVGTFVVLLGRIAGEIYDVLKDLMKAISEIPNDLCCLMKATTKIMALM